MELREVIIQQIKADTKPVREGKNNKGVEWKMYNIGLKIKDTWVNGTTFDYNELLEINKWESGQSKLLVFFQEHWKDKNTGEEKKAWKFRTPTVHEENNYLLKNIWSKLCQKGQ